ncbi:hypothetical protein BC828DRAFT_390749 [Blastocladiella britannica]|nr:hypothetical protein BC828DRAFT_390749 [Blastocladiella britannica]
MARRRNKIRATIAAASHAPATTATVAVTVPQSDPLFTSIDQAAAHNHVGLPVQQLPPAARKRQRSDSLKQANAQVDVQVALSRRPRPPMPASSHEMPDIAAAAALVAPSPSVGFGSLTLASAAGTPRVGPGTGRKPKAALRVDSGSNDDGATPPYSHKSPSLEPVVERASHVPSPALPLPVTVVAAAASPSPMIRLQQTPTTRPAVKFDLAALRKPLKMEDLRDFVLWCLHDEAMNPRFAMVKNRTNITKFVFLHVPRLDPSLLVTSLSPTALLSDPVVLPPDRRAAFQVPTSTNLDYITVASQESLCPELAPLAIPFPVLIPTRTEGERNRLSSPASLLINVPLTGAEKKAIRRQEELDRLTDNHPVTPMILPLAELLTHGYPIHPCLDPSIELAAGWVATNIPADSPLPSDTGRKLLAIDCEMCDDEDGMVLARISIVNEAGKTVLDTLVKPNKPILDYKTQYSGITAKLMEGVTTTLADVQAKVLEIVTSQTILIGHSLENDFRAMQMAHPFVIDTAISYGPASGGRSTVMHKPSLKQLARIHLSRDIQMRESVAAVEAQGGDASLGHCSIEDALACMDLVKLKIARGMQYGTGDMSVHLLDRLRTGARRIKSAWCDGSKACYRDGSSADYRLIANNDDDIARSVRHSVNGTDAGFVWGRLLDLERYYNNSSTNGADGPIGGEFAAAAGIVPNPTFSPSAATAHLRPVTPALPSASTPGSQSLPSVLAATTERILSIWTALPPGAMMVVASGNGDSGPMNRAHVERRAAAALRTADVLAAVNGKPVQNSEASDPGSRTKMEEWWRTVELAKSGGVMIACKE